MTDARAISAQLVDIRNVGTHKVVKLTLHAPEEQAMMIMKLFGWPTGVNPIPVALARLDQPLPLRAESQPSAEAAPRPAMLHSPVGDETTLPPHPAVAAPRPVLAPSQPTTPAGENKIKRQFAEMAPSQQAGMLSQDQAFWRFLEEKHPATWNDCNIIGVRFKSDIAAAVVRELCEVNSRAEITPDNANWSALVLAYRLWQREPEFVPA